MARGSVVDDISNVARLAVIAGVGIVLLKPRPDGTSLLQAMTNAVGLGLDLTGGGQLPGAPAAGGPSPSLPPPATHHADNLFDFADSTRLSYSAFGANVYGHISVVHRGSGGPFRLVVQVRSIGFLGFVGQGPWLTVLDQPIGVHQDADWAGYGHEVSFTLPEGIRPTAMQVQASILGLSGEHYQTRPVGVGPSW